MTSLPLDGNPSSTPPRAEAPSPLVDNPLLQAIALEQKKNEWASWVESEFTKCKNVRTNIERQWYLNLAFYNSKQYLSPVELPGGQGFRLVAPKAPAHRVRLVINKIRTAIRTEVAKLSSSKPIPMVVPSTNEEEDFSAAKIGEQILKNQFNSGEFNATYRSWVFWGSTCGTSYLKQFWNPHAIDPNAQPDPQPVVGPDGQPVIHPLTGEPIMQEPELVKGKIDIERVSPFHVYVPDPLTEDLNKQPYLMHVTTRDPKFILKVFGIDVPPDANAATSMLEAGTLIHKGTNPVNDSVMVKEVWLKPGAHKDFDKGGLLTIVGGKCVQVSEEWPLPYPEYPFYPFHGMPTGGFFRASIIEDLIPLQKEYNRTRSQMIEIKNTVGKPKLLYAKGSINPRMINSEPGQGIPYTAGYPTPIPMPGTEVPASFYNELQQLVADFDDISSQHEITRGNTPPQVTSGTAIAFLQEQDDSKLSDHISSIEHAIELLGRHHLKLVANYWEVPHLVKVAGKDNAYEASHWKGSDLKGNTDVRIQSGSALPFSRAAKTAMITEFMQNGWLDPASGLEVLELGAFDKVIEEALVDKKQAQRENLKLSGLDPAQVEQAMQPPVGPDGQPLLDAQGNPPPPKSPLPVNSWDNHEAHIHFHNQYRKTQEFELLAEPIKQAFEAHVQMHQYALMAMMGGTMTGAAGPVSQPQQASGEGGTEGDIQESPPQ